MHYKSLIINTLSSITKYFLENIIMANYSVEYDEYHMTLLPLISVNHYMHTCVSEGVVELLLPTDPSLYSLIPVS